jgi:hypothetical protein
MHQPHHRALVALFLLMSIAPPTAADAGGPAESQLRATWVGRQVVLRTAALSNCDDRYTNNRLRGTLPKAGGRHRFDPGELGRVDNLHVQRARIDVLVALLEPLRVELRAGPFQLYELRECRVELEIPVARAAVQRHDVDRLDGLLAGVLEAHDDDTTARESPLWNRRQAEPLPDDHDERLAAYHAWQEQQLYLALRDRLAEALDRAGDIAARADGSVAYARGLVQGVRDFEPERLFSAACGELPGASFGPRRRRPPEELEGRDATEWKDGLEDGQRLRFELALARRLERCLP